MGSTGEDELIHFPIEKFQKKISYKTFITWVRYVAFNNEHLLLHILGNFHIPILKNGFIKSLLSSCINQDFDLHCT